MKSVSSSNARFSPARSNARICVYRPRPASSASAVSTTPNRYCSPNSRPSSQVVPGTLDIEEQVAVGRFGQREQPPVGDQAAAAVPFGLQDLVPATGTPAG